MSRQPHHEPPSGSGTVSADPVELFFDLAFVFALARLVGYLHSNISPVTVLRALVLLMLMWWAWSQFTWAANAVGSSNRPVRAVFLVATVATVPLGAAVPGAFGNAGGVFAAAWAGLVLSGVAVYLAGLRGDREQRAAVSLFALRSLPGILVVAAGAWLSDPTARLGAWAIGFGFLVLAAALAGGSGFRIVPSHFAERYGLFVIVALGETIVAVGIGVAERATDPAVLGTLVAGGTLAALLWWSYFDRPAPQAEARLHEATGAARGRLARDLYTYLHLPISAGIVLVAVALEEVVLHPGDPLPLAVRGVFAGGLALFLGGFVLGTWRAARRFPMARAVALVCLGTGVLVSGSVAGLVVLIAVDAVIVAMLLIEAALDQPGAHGVRSPTANPG